MRFCEVFEEITPVGLGVWVGRGVRVGVRVGLGVRVGVRVGVSEGVEVLVSVGVLVAVAVAEAVKEGLDRAPTGLCAEKFLAEALRLVPKAVIIMTARQRITSERTQGITLDTGKNFFETSLIGWVWPTGPFSSTIRVGRAVTSIGFVSSPAFSGRDVPGAGFVLVRWR